MIELNTRQGQIALSMTVCVLVSVIWQLVPHPAVIVVLGLLPLMGLYVLESSFIMVLLFVIFSFFRLHEAFPQLYTLKIPLLLAIASLGVLSWHLLLSRRIKPYWSPELSLFSIFFLLVTLGVVMASNRSLALEYYTGTYIKIGIMTLAIAWLTRKPRDFSLASMMIVLAGITVGLVALSNKANGIGMVEGTRVTIGRDMGSLLGDPNDLALVLLFPISFAASLVMTRGAHWSMRLLGLVAVPILFSAILATQSRGGLLGMLAVFGVFAYNRIRSKALVSFIGIVLAVGLFALAGVSERASGGAAEDGIDESAMGRIYAWEAAFYMALHNPVTGVGINNFYANYFFYSQFWDGKPHSVHSTWFGVLAETGFIGLFVFISMISMLVISARRSLEKICSCSDVPVAIHATSQAVLAGMIGTIISGSFLTQGFTWPLYILMALIVALSHWVKRYRVDT